MAARGTVSRSSYADAQRVLALYRTTPEVHPATLLQVAQNHPLLLSEQNFGGVVSTPFEAVLVKEYSDDAPAALTTAEAQLDEYIQIATGSNPRDAEERWPLVARLGLAHLAMDAQLREPHAQLQRLHAIAQRAVQLGFDVRRERTRLRLWFWLREAAMLPFGPTASVADAVVAARKYAELPAHVLDNIVVPRPLAPVRMLVFQLAFER